MTGLEVTFELEGMIEKEKLLFLPLGVVSGLFIGSVSIPIRINLSETVRDIRFLESLIAS